MIAALLLVAAALPAGGPRATVALSPAAPAVGDRIEALLTLVLPSGLELAGEPRFPSWGKAWGEAEVLAADPPLPAGDAGPGAVRQRLVLAAWRPGEVALPPATIAVPLASGTVAVATPGDVAITVRSVLPPGDDAVPPKPALPPRQLPWGDAFWWSLGAGVLLCAAAAELWHRRGHRAGYGTPVAAVLAPLAELLARLDGLDPGAGDEPLHTALSLALRRYLGRALGFPAPESTTSEIQRQLLARRVPPPLARRAVRLLRECDQVKFARQRTTPAAAAERLAEARRVALELEAHLRPPEAEPLARSA
jgi:hypothetical protein